VDKYHLVLPANLRYEIMAWCIKCLPEEGCGLLIGDIEQATVKDVYLSANAAKSAKLYSIDGRDYLRADRQAEAEKSEIMGVFHSHTHTDPYPSATDVELAPDPNWHYVLVSLRHEVPIMRSYRIVNAVIEEEPIFDGLKTDTEVEVDTACSL